MKTTNKPGRITKQEKFDLSCSGKLTREEINSTFESLRKQALSAANQTWKLEKTEEFIQIVYYDYSIEVVLIAKYSRPETEKDRQIKSRKRENAKKHREIRKAKELEREKKLYEKLSKKFKAKV